MTEGDAAGEPKPRPEVYRQRHRLTHNEQFRAVHEKGFKKPAGPLVVLALPNGLTHPRLGLSVSRRVGNAVQRNAIKRRLRDAFRVVAARWPEGRLGLDLVLIVRPHEVRTPASYVELLTGAIDRLARLAAKKSDDAP